MGPFLTQSLREKLGSSLFASNFLFYESLDSTNSKAKDLALQGAPEGTLVLAEQQSAGRGRMGGRPWLSPGYVNLLFSLLLRPPVKAEQVFVLTMVFALAARDAVEDTSSISPSIKWPNDLYFNGKKLGGILTEFSVKNTITQWVVLGLGLNVNWSPEESSSVLYPATNLSAEAGKQVSREQLLVNILNKFEDYYSAVLMRDFDGLYKRWNDYSMLLDRRVEIKDQNGSILGTVLRVDKSGALIILDDHGEEQRILCGDVSVRETRDAV